MRDGRKLNRHFTIAVICTTLLCSSLLHAQASHQQSQAAATVRSRIVLSNPLPAMKGSSLKATLVEVRYGPGEASTPHSHPCPVVGYVVSGAIRTQVKGSPAVIVHAGESFFEPPNGVHLVSANASRTEPAMFLAYFVCDHDAPLSAAASITTGENQ
jgi:quercetin dioxygenase-like cupin family protein